MTNHVAIAGLLCDIVGAALLARALAFETPLQYVRDASAPKDWAALAGIDPPRDRARAEEGAEGRLGAALLLFGFLGQAVGSLKSSWSGTESIAAYGVALVAIAVALVARRVLAWNRWREIFLARLATRSDPAHRYELAQAYLKHFLEHEDDVARLEGWIADSERRSGRHPWAELVQDGKVLPIDSDPAAVKHVLDESQQL